MFLLLSSPRLRAKHSLFSVKENQEIIILSSQNLLFRETVGCDTRSIFCLAWALTISLLQLWHNIGRTRKAEKSFPGAEFDPNAGKSIEDNSIHLLTILFGLTMLTND